MKHRYTSLCRLYQSVHHGDPVEQIHAFSADPELPLPRPERLCWPIDTPGFQWAKAKGIPRRASPNWKTVEEITAFFRELEPSDPVKYDFAVCHIGMERARSRKIRGSR